MKAAIIIGGGPAGSQCALWLHMLGYEVAILEKSDKLGGLQNRNPYINNWMVGTIGLPGEKVAQNIDQHIKQIDIPIYFNCELTNIQKIPLGFTIQAGKLLIDTRNLVIATGVSPKRADFIETENIIIGPGKNIENYSFVNKRVAILGGGDNAAENYGLIKKKLPQLCHIYARNIKARRPLWSQIDPKDIYLHEYSVEQNTMAITHKNIKQHYDVLVVLYGWEANFPPALESMKIDLLDEKGFIFTNSERRTRIANIFAIGEATQQTHPCVITSMADGVIAAKAIQNDLEQPGK